MTKLKLTIFDPSIENNQGMLSLNLGDLIIRDSINAVLDDIFPDAELTRVSTHSFPNKDAIDKVQQSDLAIVAGTNILSSHVLKYDQWKLKKGLLTYVNPPSMNTILLGVGWWQYQDKPDFITRHYYKKLLRSDGPHATRDSYSLSQLSACGVKGLFNTSCPTMWSLNQRDAARIGNNKRCLFCLTDYARDEEADDNLIRKLAKIYNGGLIFFPQGSHDLEYFHSLPASIEMADNILVLSHQYEQLINYDNAKDLDYVGTRLHAGVWCLSKGIPSLILSVDNRAWEIGADTGLPVIKRGDWDALSRWHSGADFNNMISIPQSAIDAWKDEALKVAEKTQRG
ncbi:MAG: polysaccharide pyruvyl transferase family protein [Desulfarculaceae bacterium]|nr:polysaccharide pyruvyl transferase family protein [Desulfarculaceae bacterium]